MEGRCVGELLFLNLTKGTFEEKTLSEELARNLISGYGIGARLHYDMMKPGVDPLGPERFRFCSRTVEWNRSYVWWAVHGCLKVSCPKMSLYPECLQ